MFYSVYLSKNTEVLSWRMSGGLRAALGFALLSVLAMFIWAFAPGEYAEYSLFARINLVLMPLLLITAVLYEDSVVLNRKEGWLERRVGLVFLKRVHRWPAEELLGLEYRVVRGSGKSAVKNGSNGFSSNFRTRVLFGFQMKDRLIILDRSCRPGKAETWLRAFQAFWPYHTGVEK